MRTERLSNLIVVAAMLGITMGGCGSDTNTSKVTGSGGATTGSGGSGTGGDASGTGGSSTTTVTGGVTATGGVTVVTATGGVSATGGSSTQNTGGTTRTGGVAGTGGVNSGGSVGATGGTATGGRTETGGRVVDAGASTGGGTATGTGTRTTTTTGTGTGTTTGTCVASVSTGRNVSGSGSHKVVMETNPAAGIKCGTIYRPADLGGAEKYPILVWGEGGCSQNGLSNQAAMAEVASQGYFVVADGTPGGTGACTGGQDGKAFLDYITWAIAENGKSCSAYYQALDTTKIAADGFSCGGLMAENVSGDPRFTAIGITSSGLMGSNKALYDKIHTPFKIMNGGSSDMAYTNGLNDYTEISSRKIPILYFSKTSAGHGGDLNNAKGDFNTVNLAWWNWQLKGDEGATGKGLLIGDSCKYCKASGWEFKSANIP